MPIRVTVKITGLTEVLSNLDRIGNDAEQNLRNIVATLAEDTKIAWNDATPSRTGRLRGGEIAPASGLRFQLEDAVYYYPFVNDGHMTPRGWHTKHGYRPAKRRSHVEGKFMTEAAVDFVSNNILNRLSRFLPD